MRKLFLLSLIFCLGLSPHISANSSEEGIQKIIDYLIEGKKVSNKKITLQEIQFSGETANIASESKSELDKIAELLLKIPTVSIEISNHTDNKGDKNNKKQLTQRRAKSVVDYLILKGVPYQQLNYKGWGWHRPMADNRSAEGRKKNNRTELLITGLLEGPHKITTAQNIIPVANFVIEEDKVIYWKTSTSDTKNIALNEVQQIDLAYGKLLTFAGTTVQNKVVAEEKPQPKITKPNTPSPTQAKTQTPPTQTTFAKPSIAETRSKEKATTQKPRLTKKQKTSSPKKQQEIVVNTDPFKSSPTETDKKKNKDRTLVKTPTSRSTSTENKVTNSASTPVSTPQKTEIAKAKNLPQAKPQKTITQPKEVKNKEELTKTTKNLKQTITNKKRSTTATAYADLVIPKISAEEEQALLSTYLTGYQAPQKRGRDPLYSENILKQYDADFDWRISDGVIVETTNIWGKIKYLFLKSKGEPKEKQASSGGYMFHLGQRPIHVESSAVSLRYQDASGRSENIRLNKTLTENSRGFVFRAGVRYGTDKWEGYFAGDFGGRNGARYNAAVFGLMYKKAFGKFSILPGAEISLGAGKFELEDVNVETPIFTVKKKDFLGNNISLAYKNKLLGLSPTAKLVYNVSPKFDIYVSTGYMLALRTGSRIKFSGTGTDEASVSTNEKLKADNLTFTVNGETLTRQVDILNYNGLLFRLGVFINMPTN